MHLTSKINGLVFIVRQIKNRILICRRVLHKRFNCIFSHRNPSSFSIFLFLQETLKIVISTGHCQQDSPKFDRPFVPVFSAACCPAENFCCKFCCAAQTQTIVSVRTASCPHYVRSKLQRVE